jgi:hypothetical protein
MKRFTILIVFLILLLFTGCGNVQPELPTYSISKQDRIGYIIDIKNKVEHTHMGTTIFNNFDKTYKYKWNLANYIDNSLQNKLGSNLVDLSKHGYKVDDVKDIISANDNKWIISNKTTYNKLLSELNLKAIVIFYDAPKSIFLYPYSYETKGTGLLSHHVIGIKRYFTVLGVKSTVFVLNPLAKVETEDKIVEIIYDPLISSYEEKSGFVIPSDIENITEKEFEPVKKSNITHLDILIGNTLDYLLK